MEESSNPRTEDCGNQMFLVDLTKTVSEASSFDDVLSEVEGLWSSIYDRMASEETLWVVVPNDYQNGRMWPAAMAVADLAREETSLVLKNTITTHTWNDRGADMESAYDEILLLVKDKRDYQFHKDRIRVEHVYEGNEWGGEREKGNSSYHDTKVRRYNPDGKDPGNVWLEEERTLTSNQEVDETRPLSILEAVRRCVLAGSNEGEVVYLVDVDDDIEEIIVEEERVADSLDVSALQSEVSE